MEKRGSKRCSKFSSEVLKEKDANGDVIGIWCTAGNKSWEAYCCICEISINCSLRGTSAVKRHANSVKHIEKCKHNRKENGELKKPSHLRFSSHGALPKSFGILSQEDKYLSAEIMFSLSIAQTDTTYKYGDVATKIFPKMFSDSMIAKNFSCGRKKLSYFISDGIGLHIKNELINEIIKTNSYFSVLIDETPLSEKRLQQLDLNVRFYSEKQNQIISHHLDSHFIGHATSDILLEKINFSLNKLPSDKVLNLFTDGPNVMKSLKAKMRDFFPNLVDIGTCNLHVLHNAFNKGLEVFGSDIESLVIDIYYFFKHSAVQSEDLKVLQQNLALPEHVLLRHVNNRWLRLHVSINRLIEQFSALQIFFTKGSINSARSKRISEIFLSKSLYGKLLFLRNASSMFQDILKLFQRDEPLVHILYNELVNFLKEVMGRFLVTKCFSTLDGLGLLKIDVERGENWLNHAEIGLDTEEELRKLPTSDKKNIRLGARAFYISVTKYLIQKLPLKNKLLRDLKCLHPSYISEAQSLQCLKSVVSTVSFIIPSNEVSKLIDEWICLQTEDLKSLQCVKKSLIIHEESDLELEENDTINELQRIDHFWNTIFQIQSNSGLKYKFLPTLIKSLLCLSHGNSDCERGFSVNKRILENRSNLNISSINGLRQIKSHMKRLNNDISKFEINFDLLKATKNARQTYQKRLNTEKETESKKRKIVTDNEKLNKNLLEEKELHNKLLSAQSMLSMAEKHIEDGLKTRDLKLIEGGQVLLKEAKEKIPILTQKINENKKQQLKLNEQLYKKR